MMLVLHHGRELVSVLLLLLTLSDDVGQFPRFVSCHRVDEVETIMNVIVFDDEDDVEVAGSVAPKDGKVSTAIVKAGDIFCMNTCKPVVWNFDVGGNGQV